MLIAFSRNDPREVRVPASLEEYIEDEQTARWKPSGTATQEAQPPRWPSQGTGLAWLHLRQSRVSQVGSRVLLKASQNEVVLFAPASTQGDSEVLLHQASGQLSTSWQLLTGEHHASLQNQVEP